jgi:SAM-dependent methyltransferase
VPDPSSEHQIARVGYRDVTALAAQRANRADWDREADDYQREHGGFLRDVGFVWSPEGLDEAHAKLLGDVAGRRVLEVGCGAGQCSRWLAARGAQPVGIDLSFRQLQHSRRIDAETSLGVPVVCATATALPLPDESFDIACSAFGALPFLLDIDVALAEVRRVLRPGGRFIFSVVHPVRRMLPDDPSEAGLTVVRSYFDRTPYVELAENDEPSYVEPHHTLGDWVGAVVGSGLTVEDLVEPEWPAGHRRVWGGWGPYRGALVPGTAIFVTQRSPRLHS